MWMHSKTLTFLQKNQFKGEHNVGPANMNGSFECRLIFNWSWTKFIEIIVNVLVFILQIFRLTILSFSSRTLLISQVTFSRLRSAFLSDLFCSLTEVKLDAKIKSIAAFLKEGPDSRVGSASGLGAGGQWLESRRG